MRVRAAVQLLLVQACGEIHARHGATMPAPSLSSMLDALRRVSDHALAVDDDMALRRALAFAQAEDQVCQHICDLVIPSTPATLDFAQAEDRVRPRIYHHPSLPSVQAGQLWCCTR